MQASHTQVSASRLLFSPAFSLAFSLLLASLAVQAPLAAQGDSPKGNYKLANKFSTSFINQYVHSTSVRPRWIGETDRFWYQFKTSSGQHYWLVDCATATKKPLFDHDEFAAKLSLALRTPLDAPNLDLRGASLDDKGRIFKFSYKGKAFEYDLQTEALVAKGKASATPAVAPRSARFSRSRRRSSRGGSTKKTPWSHRAFSPDKTAYVFVQRHDLYLVEAPRKVKAEVDKMTVEIEKKKKAKEAAKKAGKTLTEKGDDKKTVDDKKKTDDKKKVDVKKKVDKKKTDKKKTDEKKKNDKKTDDKKTDDKKKDAPKDDRDKREKWADKMDEKRARRLSTDGEKLYSFGPRSFRRNLEESKKEDPKEKQRPSVNWAKNSEGFSINRNDTRGVNELFLINSLSQPRPKLERYQYAMPGEDKISRSDLYFFHRASKKLSKVKLKWKQESYLNVHWKPESCELRFVRRDRLRRNLELVNVNIATGKHTSLFEDSFEVGVISNQSVRYLEKRKQMIWWSERSGWGHYYLYELDGKLKNTITWGTFRASRIVEVDEEKGILYFMASGREKNKDDGVKENIYYQHLYRVFLDGTGLQLMDPGNATHSSVLSPSKRFVVDNCSRVDLAPRTMLRNAHGHKLMDLEKTDLKALETVGWRMPETFVVKAADGVTDLFGNMWKPFDFDPNKKYPIILHVYPGPQQEGVTHSFSATGRGRQQLAQLGFIVIQVGHRGGTPGRSKAYQNHSYWNMRDYALEDKKVAVEKLAARNPFIDIDRVGVYGHSGGGFFTATALLKPPYNEFFKVGVSSAGNHDNNIYNNSWSERYHGLKEVEVKEKKKSGKGDKKDGDKKDGVKKDGDKKDGDKKTDVKKTNGKKVVVKKGKQDDKKSDKKSEKKAEKKTKFEIHIPTTWELAKNLKGKLLIVHGDMDNNVHPAGTIRLVDALIKANKRFDMLFIPGARHGFGAASRYFTQRMWEYFSEHLLGDYQRGADILEKSAVHRR